MSNFSILNAPAKDHFGYEFKTYIQIPKTGVYNFYLYSDDGSLLYIDGRVVIDNNGSHTAARKGGKIVVFISAYLQVNDDTFVAGVW